MVGVITTGNHPKALWPGIKAWWGRSYDEHVVELDDLFDRDTSNKAYEEDVEVTGFGLAPVKSEGAATAYDSEAQGTVTRYTHVAYSLGYIVTYEELQDDLYEVVSKRRSQALAFSDRQTQENVAANVYNRGFNTAFPQGDGKAIFVTDHPSLSGDQSNTLATAADMSEASIEDLVIQIMGATNSRGLKISLMPKKLIVPRQLTFEATRILKSQLQNDTANNALNALQVNGVFPEGICVNHYLTDADAWFIRTNAPRGFIHYEREASSFTKDNDFDTSNAKAKVYCRNSYGITDWRGGYASPGA